MAQLLELGIRANYDLGIAFLLTAAGVLFTAIQIMFEVRESEIRQGVDLKC